MAAASVREALGAATDALTAVGVEAPRLDAELLLGEATGRDRAALIAAPEGEVPAAAARLFGEMVRRRLRREPVAYIVGRRGFRRLELAVDRRVLVPRPETELLVEVALEREPRTLLDVGTGSGAIALAVADELPDCEVMATDTSAAALEVARANAERLGLAGRVRFLEGTVPDGAFDLVLANLPYVAEPDWPTLQPEVTQWEPREALLAGPDGLDAIRAFLSAPRSAGCVALEVGEGQAAAVAGLLREAGFWRTEARRDLAGIERVVVGER
ncbi:MAG TPA: peptide chain release factor N(5)-glutamine methyltransferase [Solirubrobacterales bacterium]|nr:peptide chain release factor N(5)-glutamine methyltransferase [Solirubrobacterales bacterium]